MRTQVVRTAPSTISNGQYLTPKGVRLKKEGASKRTLLKYTKTKRVLNPDSKPLTVITYIDSQGKLRSKPRRIKHVI